MTTDTKSANAAPTEVVTPLTPVEAALVKTVGEFRERERQRLEVEWQKVQLEGNRRIEPLLRLHGVTGGDTFEIRDDETSATGLALAVKKGGAAADTPAVPDAAAPLDRVSRRRLEKEITKRAGRRGGK